MGDNNGAVEAPEMGLLVDMRSDTVTKPTLEMIQACADAEVDDDVQGRDPTTQKLEEYVSALFGKEDAIFVPSGTMANLIALMTHCPERGSEFIVGDKAHIYLYEQGGSAQLAGIHPRVVPNQADGSLALDEVCEAIRVTGNEHFPVTKLVCIENTQNKCGGRVLDVDYMDKLGMLCQENGLKLHVDGARIMNACAALQVSPARLTQNCDSVSCCLSKALGAPVGSVLIGSSEFIKRARRGRKVLGGSMRQNGVIAAMGLYAIQKHAGDNLRNDHKNLKALAEGFSALPGLEIDMESVQSNIVYMNTYPIEAKAAASKIAEKGIKINVQGKYRIRCVTHHQISKEGIDAAIAAFSEVFSS